MSYIGEKAEHAKYHEVVLSKAREPISKVDIGSLEDNLYTPYISGIFLI